MNEDPLDLTPLDPTRDPAFDDRVSAILRAARVGASPAVTDYLSRWIRPALAAAAVIAALGVIPLVRQTRAPAAGSTAAILGVPPGLLAIARSGAAPGVADLADAFDVEAHRER